MKTVYEVVNYRKKISEYGRKEVEISANVVQDFTCKSVEDAHTVAKIADFKIYGIIKLEIKDDGYYVNDEGTRIFVTPEVLEWEKIVNQQRQAADNRKKRADTAMSKMPDKIVLYRNKEFYIFADLTDGRYSDKHYYGHVKYKGQDLGWGGLAHYYTDPFTGPKHLLKKKFAQDVYQRTHTWTDKMSYTEWKDTLKNLSPKYVEKYGDILTKSVNKLDEYNAKIKQIRNSID